MNWKVKQWAVCSFYEEWSGRYTVQHSYPSYTPIVIWPCQAHLQSQNNRII